MSAVVISFPCSPSQFAATAQEPRPGVPGISPVRPQIVAGLDHAKDPAASSRDLRKWRREVWRMAERAAVYWQARRDLWHAISLAQSVNLPEGRGHAAADPETHWALVQEWRTAFARQLLTPAPDLAAVKWKQAVLARGALEHTTVSATDLEQSIAADLAFLAAHPMRLARRSTEVGA